MSEEVKTYIVNFISQRFSENKAEREEALREVLTATQMAENAEAAESLAMTIPPLPTKIYEKWAGIFADRLLETVPRNQIDELCSGTEVNVASLTLLFAMFMETERMEKQKAKDLEELNKEIMSE